MSDEPQQPSVAGRPGPVHKGLVLNETTPKRRWFTCYSFRVRATTHREILETQELVLVLAQQTYTLYREVCNRYQASVVVF